MPLSRSPSPMPIGSWNVQQPSYQGAGPYHAGMNGFADNDAHWAAAKARSKQIRGSPTITRKNEGFFQRSRRKISQTLPMFNKRNASDGDWRHTEKLGRGRPNLLGQLPSNLKTIVGNILRRFKILIALLATIATITMVMSSTWLRTGYRRSASWGGGSKFVMILAANEGGGVMEWKGPREWAIERDSIENKRAYANRWGYNLEIADMSTKKRYAHEWRESWEKVDIIRNCMAKYPQAEWFWWLDLTTFIMEPSISLQQHIFNSLADTTYRDINHYNPLNISHPLRSEFLDPVTTSPTGDNLTSSIDMVIPQDCSGFNLGSFFLRRSAWTDRLLDIWWDPVLYEQNHMQWDHKEQDALEHLYESQPYLRTRFGFIEQRMINSFPPGACKPEGAPEDFFDPRFHYSADSRDFLVNMAGCEWRQNCWAEMYQYRELSNKLNRSTWQKLKDWFTDSSREAEQALESQVPDLEDYIEQDLEEQQRHKVV